MLLKMLILDGQFLCVQYFPCCAEQKRLIEKAEEEERLIKEKEEKRIKEEAEKQAAEEKKAPDASQEAESQGTNEKAQEGESKVGVSSYILVDPLCTYYMLVTIASD